MNLIQCSLHWLDISDTRRTYVEGQDPSLGSQLHCDFPQEDALSGKSKRYSEASFHVHCGQTLRGYMESQDWGVQYEKEGWNEWYSECAANLKPTGPCWCKVERWKDVDNFMNNFY